MFCSTLQRHSVTAVTTTRRRRHDDEATTYSTSYRHSAFWQRQSYIKTTRFVALPLGTARGKRCKRNANTGPAPRPPDYLREPFATHSGKKHCFFTQHTGLTSNAKVTGFVTTFRGKTRHCYLGRWVTCIYHINPHALDTSWHRFPLWSMSVMFLLKRMVP